MDVFSHGLWAGAGAKAVNLKKKKSLRVWLAVLFGVFPDVFAFAISFTYLNYLRIMGRPMPFSIRPGIEPPGENHNFLLNLTHNLYNISHSLFVFFVIFAVVAWACRRPVWEMGGWMAHILMDIPSHSYAFFPMPFLWPFSSFMVNGIPWGTPAFFWTNYSLIIFFYTLLWYLKKRKKKHG
jgi:hypothetical protein